ncbi:type VI secretion system-associated protein TagF [Roseibium sp. SCP14]|uniref:type VI secretion system-associated protein TagF n=1 Tax=Roseibium sp. SCP14 TaxID=3141375 RepID=UPI003335A673
MTVGYFGKLPARADFVTNRCPNGFLKVWEPFLNEGIARSRLDLKEAWQEAYMTMPVWRFWLSSCVSGGSFEGMVTGAVMPSVDKVGREFPLTIVVRMAEDKTQMVASEDWYCDVEAILLQTLEDGAELSDFQSAVARLVAPDIAARPLIAKHSTKLAPRLDEEHNLQCVFWCAAAGSQVVFECAGLPHAEELRWLLLPEDHPETRMQSGKAGNNHGRFQSEDQRT